MQQKNQREKKRKNILTVKFMEDTGLLQEQIPLLKIEVL